MTEQAQTKKVKLGNTGPEVFPLGLGCMGMSGVYGKTDDKESVATIQAAIDAGVTLIDTGDFYGMGHNELLVGRALEGRRDRAQISVKFGAQRDPKGAFLGFDGRPAAVKSFVSYSLVRLGVEVIDVYRPARLDPNVPIEETIGAVADLIKAGYVKHIGLSEVGAETIRRAHAVHPIVDLQIEYSIASREPEKQIFPVLAELGISATLYGIFSRGLLTGSKPQDPTDFRKYLPRFSGDNAGKNEDLAKTLRRFAEERGLTPGQLAINWALAKQPALVPVLGIKTRAQLKDSLDALAKPLSQDDLTALETLVPAQAFAGTRYTADQMKHLDSER